MGGSEVGFLTGYVSPGVLFDGEPVTAQVLHGVYVIVAEEAQADLAERAGQHRLCHSHIGNISPCYQKLLYSILIGCNVSSCKRGKILRN